MPAVGWTTDRWNLAGMLDAAADSGSSGGRMRRAAEGGPSQRDSISHLANEASELLLADRLGPKSLRWCLLLAGAVAPLLLPQHGVERASVDWSGWRRDGTVWKKKE